MAGKMAQWLRALAAFPEDPGSIPIKEKSPPFSEHKELEVKKRLIYYLIGYHLVLWQ